MNIRQMQVFQAVCENEGFTRAAKALHMTQPAVSHVILDLEEETGVQLFERISRKIYITEPGRQLLGKVEALLALYGEVQESAGAIGERGKLKIGSSITIANFWLPGLLSDFQKRFPEIPVTVQVDSAHNIEEMLMKNEVDIGFLEGAVHYTELVSEAFSSYEMKAFFAPSYPLAGEKGQITAEKLAGEKLLLREKGSAIRDTLDSALLLRNLYAKPVMTSVNSQALIQSAKMGLGVTVLPGLLVEREVQELELTAADIRDMPLVNSNCVVYHKNKYMTVFMSSMLELIRESREA